MSNILWTIHLKTEEQREKMKTNLKSKHSDPVFIRLEQILESKKQEVLSSMTQEFDTAGWATRHAFLMGQLRSLEETLNLLKI